MPKCCHGHVCCGACVFSLCMVAYQPVGWGREAISWWGWHGYATLTSVIFSILCLSMRFLNEFTVLLFNTSFDWACQAGLLKCFTIVCSCGFWFWNHLCCTSLYVLHLSNVSSRDVHCIFQMGTRTRGFCAWSYGQWIVVRVVLYIIIK